MNYFPRNPPKRTIRGVSNDTDLIHLDEQYFHAIRYISLTLIFSYIQSVSGGWDLSVTLKTRLAHLFNVLDCKSHRYLLGLFYYL